MVKLKGKITIKFHHKDTGEETRSPITQENLIFDNTYLLLLGANPQPLFDSFTVIVISSTNTPPVASVPTITNVLATGFIPAGVTSPIWYESVTPNFGEIQNQINAPTVSPRTFETVGLRRSGTDLTATLLTIPCTQELFEVLTIFYRIEVSNSDGEGMTPRFTRDFGGRIFGIKSCSPNILGTSYADPPTQEYIDIRQNAELISGVGRNWTTTATVNSHYKYKESTTFQIAQSGVLGASDEYIGLIFNSMLSGRSNAIAPSASFIAGNFTEGVSSAYRISRYNATTINIDPLKPVFQPPFQKIWTHRAGAPLPFFDPNNAAFGTSYPVVEGTWTGKWPELYRYTITSNTGDYKFSKRLHLGFNGNTYSDRSVIVPFRNVLTPSALGMHGWRIEDNDLLRWSDTQIVQYDNTGVTLLDLITGDYTNWDATTTPVLNVTSLRQCAVDTVNGLIYCACRNTGLWIINVGVNTTTQQVGTACYGVDVGRNNVAFAIFQGFLRNSTNWTTDLTFTYSGLTDGNWNRSLYLKVDPENTSDRLAIVMVSPSNASNRRVVWYELATTTASTGLDNNFLVPPWAAGLDVSDTGSFWATGLNQTVRLTFGSAATSNVPNVPATNVVHSIWGGVQLYKISFIGNKLICFNGLWENSYVVTFASLDNNVAILHLIGGIVIASAPLVGYTFLRQLFTDNLYCWEDYGWNGSAWVLGNTNSKPTHNTDDATIQGLTIRWEAGAVAPQFQSGDFFTQGICNGTWKDNATTIFFENFWYDKAVHFDEPVGALTVPASAPYEITLSAASNPLFRRIETDSLNDLNKFTIAGVAVPTIYTNGTPPAAGEVSLNAVTGAIVFNSADAGKTFDGVYAWIEI